MRTSARLAHSPDQLCKVRIELDLSKNSRLKNMYRQPEFHREITIYLREYDLAMQDAYQLSELNPAEFNYAVMSSLSSFLELAPASLHVPFLTKDLLEAVREFENNKQQKFATSKVRRFHEVAKKLVAQLAVSTYRLQEFSSKLKSSNVFSMPSSPHLVNRQRFTGRKHASQQ